MSCLIESPPDSFPQKPSFLNICASMVFIFRNDVKNSPSESFVVMTRDCLNELEEEEEDPGPKYIDHVLFCTARDLLQYLLRVRLLHLRFRNDMTKIYAHFSRIFQHLLLMNNSLLSLLICEI